MFLLTPRMPEEPPPTYVAFVERHLPRLRADATRLVGEHGRAEDVFPDALTDVAGRWRLLGRLDRAATWIGRRPDLADAFLWRALERRAKLWRDQQITPVEVHVWRIGPDPAPPPPPQDAVAGGDAAPGSRAVVGTSFALRLAPVLPGNQRPELAALAEAAIAWWHAYRAARRRRYAITVTVLLVILGALSSVPQDSDRYLRSAPAPASLPWSWSPPATAPVPGCSTTTNCPIMPLSS